MIDIKFLRENPDVVRASQKGRGENVELVDQIIAIDEIKRAAVSEFETLRQEQNVLSKSVGAAKGDEKAALLANAKELADKVRLQIQSVQRLKRRQRRYCFSFQTFSIPKRQLAAKKISSPSNILVHLVISRKMALNLKTMSNSVSCLAQLIPNAVQRLLVHVHTI